jgi:hypothetical protein
LVSYPLQAVSICAGSYLLYDIAQFVWKIELGTMISYFVFAVCFAVFFSIESLRRWLVNTTGYHYLATFTIRNSTIRKGEWLRTKLLVLSCISVILICSGTYGTYLFIKHNSPQAETIDVKANLSPIEQKIQSETNAIQSIDKQVAQLQQAKKTELSDANSYLVWNNVKYLSPTVKQRHDNYDSQISKMLSQKEKHQDLMNRFEQRATEKEKTLESRNETIETKNMLSKESYSLISSAIWLCFELLLVFMLAYTWIFKYGIKREILILQLRKGIAPNHETSKPKEVLAQKSKEVLRKSLTPTLQNSFKKSHRQFLDFVLAGTKVYNISYSTIQKEVLAGIPNPIISEKLWNKLISEVESIHLANEKELNALNDKQNVRTNAKNSGISDAHIEHNLNDFSENIEPIEVEQEEVLNSIQVEGFVRYNERSNAEISANVRTQNERNERTKRPIKQVNNERTNVLKTKWKCTEKELLEMYDKGVICTVSDGERVSGMSRGKVADIRRKATEKK